MVANTSGRTFQRMLRGAMVNEVVVPTLRSLLYAPDFKEFSVPTEDFEVREADGWFHPSEHPLWPERQLFYYLTEPDRIIHDPMDPLGTMAVTQGNFWHAFFQNLLFRGNFVRNSNPNGKSVHDKVEKYVEDRETGSRGSMDGVLNSDKLPIEHDEGLELKTMNTIKIGRCPKGSPSDPAKLAWLKEKCPVYYAQAQEYLRMSGYSVQRMVFIGLEYPFEMVELAVPYSYGDSQVIADKYRFVRQCVADGIVPGVCCGIGSKERKQCPCRGICGQ